MDPAPGGCDRGRQLLQHAQRLALRGLVAAFVKPAVCETVDVAGIYYEFVWETQLVGWKRDVCELEGRCSWDACLVRSGTA